MSLLSSILFGIIKTLTEGLDYALGAGHEFHEFLPPFLHIIVEQRRFKCQVLRFTLSKMFERSREPPIFPVMYVNFEIILNCMK